MIVIVKRNTIVRVSSKPRYLSQRRFHDPLLLDLLALISFVGIQLLPLPLCCVQLPSGPGQTEHDGNKAKTSSKLSP